MRHAIVATITGLALATSACGEEDSGSPADCDIVACLTAPAAECDGSELVVYGSTGECDSEGQCVFSETRTSCPVGCQPGGCLTDACEGVTCDEAPQGYCDIDTAVTYVAPGVCEGSGSCVFSETREDCAAAGERCVNGVCVPLNSCEGIVCDQPPIGVCSGTVATRYEGRGECVEGGCTYDTETEDCADRDLQCSQGSCVALDLCQGIVCDEAPPTACQGNVVVAYEPTGECEEGECRYPSTRTPCTGENAACVDGECVTADPCDGVVCDAPPDDFCDESGERVAYATPGTCDGGICSYTTTTTPCAEGEVCIDGVCEPFDLCRGIVCNAPPPNICRGTVAVGRVVPGTCSAGICSYDETTVDCADTAQLCVSGRCVAP